MKISEFRKLIREEVKKVVTEAQNDEFFNYYIATQDTTVKNLKRTRNVPVPKGTVITAIGGGIWSSNDNKIQTGIESLKSNNAFKVVGTSVRPTIIDLVDKLENFGEQTKELIQQTPEQAEAIIKKRMQILSTIKKIIK